MSLFVQTLMETPQVDRPAKLQESKRTCATTVKGREVCKHEQDKPANNVAKSLIVTHAEQTYTDIEEYKASNTALKDNFFVPLNRWSLHSFEPGCQVAGQEFLAPQATSSPEKTPLYNKLVGAKAESVLHKPHKWKRDSDSSDSNSEGGDDNAYNIPIRNHRNREPGTEYFHYGIVWREMRELEGVESEDWDDGDTELIESLWDSTSEGDEPPALPTRDGVPLLWERHHDLIVWASRGTADEIRSQVQFLYQFSPPISEEFLLGRLNGRFAYMHLEFLFSFLSGETGTIQQARDRINMQRRDVVDSDIIAGRQTIRIHPASYLDPSYQVPPMPGNAPADWERNHDAMLNAFIGKHPTDFLEEFGDFLENGACIEFLQIRMAQSMHLGISLNEIRTARSMIDGNREVRDWISRRDARGRS